MITRFRRPLLLLNSVLVVAATVLAARLIYHHWKFREQIVVNPPMWCSERAVGWYARTLAHDCERFLKSGRKLPEQRAELLKQIVAFEKQDFGFETDNFKPSDLLIINSAGELCDCYRKPYVVAQMSDRVAVTSDSSLTFYFGRVGPAQTPFIQKENPH